MAKTILQNKLFSEINFKTKSFTYTELDQLLDVNPGTMSKVSRSEAVLSPLAIWVLDYIYNIPKKVFKHEMNIEEALELIKERKKEQVNSYTHPTISHFGKFNYAYRKDSVTDEIYTYYMKIVSDEIQFYDRGRQKLLSRGKISITPHILYGNLTSELLSNSMIFKVERAYVDGETLFFPYLAYIGNAEEEIVGFYICSKEEMYEEAKRILSIDETCFSKKRILIRKEIQTYNGIPLRNQDLTTTD